jgi:hypothetical protein
MSTSMGIAALHPSCVMGFIPVMMTLAILRFRNRLDGKPVPCTFCGLRLDELAL